MEIRTKSHLVITLVIALSIVLTGCVVVTPAPEAAEDHCGRTFFFDRRNRLFFEGNSFSRYAHDFLYDNFIRGSMTVYKMSRSKVAITVRTAMMKRIAMATG